MEADIQRAKTNLPINKEQFFMKIGSKFYTNKKEAGTALAEMCKELKCANTPAAIGEYAGFKMVVSFDSFNHKFVMNLKGQLSHNLEIGTDAFCNISRINHALESMSKEFDETREKLKNVEHQMETAKHELNKPFAYEQELKDKTARLEELNVMLNADSEPETAGPINKKKVSECERKNIEMKNAESGDIQCRSVLNRLRQFQSNIQETGRIPESVLRNTMGGVARNG